MKLINHLFLVIPTIVLISGCSLLPQKKVDDEQVVRVAQIVPTQIQSTFLEGDTLWDFAERTTGSGFNWEKIKIMNEIENEKMIDAGVVLLVPKELAIDELKIQ